MLSIINASHERLIDRLTGTDKVAEKKLKRTRAAKEGFTFPSFLFLLLIAVTDSSQLMTTAVQGRDRTSNGQSGGAPPNHYSTSDLKLLVPLVVMNP